MSNVVRHWIALFLASAGLAASLPLQAKQAEPADGSILPRPPVPFAGKIGRTAAQSVPAAVAPVKAPAGAPNVLLVMTDDVGFGASSAFGGPIPTPNLDRLARMGVRYNRFQTAAMCSPTRAALLTGRNPHRVGTGSIVDLASDYPGYSARIPRSAASIAEVLKDNGYNTAFFGKHHNVPRKETSAAGPFDLWPNALGFEYFYGFIGGAINQFEPRLYRNTIPVDMSRRSASYILDRDLADDAIDWLHNQDAAAPEKPFFVYFAPGTAHSPHQAPADWIARFKGRFDGGWDALREETFRRQKEMGIIPQNAVLTPRPTLLPAWSTLSDDKRRVDARMMEVYAAMLAFQDAQFGRMLDELERMGKLDNTLVIFIEGDNGATAEGGLVGKLNEAGEMANGVRETTAEQAARIAEIGGPNTMELFPASWGWALNTPFQWTKQIASHLGGTRNGLVISWRGHVPAGGAIRPQYGYVTDIMPTILEAAGIRQPDVVNGARQLSTDGISLAYSFADAAAPDRRKTQVYELFANRAIYRDGWLANTTPRRAPWDFSAKLDSPDTGYSWELYDLSHDFTQSRDLAASEPGRLRQLQQLWWREAEKNQILPLDDSFGARNDSSAANHPATRTSFTYWGPNVSVTKTAAPQLFGKSFSVEADIVVGAGASDGVIAAVGSRFGGWSFYLKDGRPVVFSARSEAAVDQVRIVGEHAVPPGKARIRFAFSADGATPGGGGTMRIFVDGNQVGQGHIERTVTIPVGFGESFDTGRDTGAPVSPDYTGEGAFAGRIERVEVKLEKPTAISRRGTPSQAFRRP